MTRYDMPDHANAIDRRIGQRVRARRLELGISQEALAEALGVTFQQVQKYEKGVNRVSASRLFEMAGSLGVTVSYFYEGLTLGRREGAQEDSADFVAETMATPDGLQLVALFHKLKNPRIRRRVVDLVRALVEDEIVTEGESAPSDGAD